jgi:hypothetical protein
MASNLLSDNDLCQKTVSAASAPLPICPLASKGTWLVYAWSGMRAALMGLEPACSQGLNLPRKRDPKGKGQPKGAS